MMMSGSGASTCGAEYGRAVTSRLTEVTTTTVPAGHRQPGGLDQELMRCDQAGFAWPQSNDVPSTQMQWRITAIFRAMATLAFFTPSLRELHSPGLKRGPFLRPIEQNGRRFEQVAVHVLSHSALHRARAAQGGYQHHHIGSAPFQRVFQESLCMRLRRRQARFEEFPTTEFCSSSLEVLSAARTSLVRSCLPPS